MLDIAAAWTNACAVGLKVGRGKKLAEARGRQLNMGAGRRWQGAFAAKFSSRTGVA